MSGSPKATTDTPSSDGPHVMRRGPSRDPAQVVRGIIAARDEWARIVHQGGSSEVLDRAKAFALAVVYFAFAYSTFGFARGAGKSTGAQNSGISARLMQTGAGTIALIAAGVIIVAVGAYHVYKGVSRTFLDDLKGTSCDLVRRLGTVGYIAKGLVIAGAGVLVLVAASRSEPNTATGLDGALKTLGAQSYGVALLIIAGLGIITYGLYSFAMARYTKML